MRRMAGVLLIFLSLAALPLALSASGISLRVNETETRASIQTENIEVSFAVENTGRAATARIRLELVDPKNKTRAEWERNVSLTPGANRIAASFLLSNIDHIARKEIFWYRLRYRIDSLEGIISFSEITPDLFELKVLSSLVPVEGELYRVVARAVHPVKLHPVKGVQAEADVKFSDDDNVEPLRATAVTDKNGYAVFEFRLPKEIVSRELEIEVAGRMGGISQTATDDVSIEHQAWIVISPDKPIYQPGQTLHARLLTRDAVSNRAIAAAPLTIKISDPENTMLFRATIKTSRFGIASFDWPIPQTARIGRYAIDVKVDEGEYEGSSSGPNERFDNASYNSDDFTIWTSRMDYFAEARARIGAGLAGFFKSTSRFPQDEKELGEALHIAGMNVGELRDPWGNRFYATFKNEASYADRVTLQSYAVYGSQPDHRTEVVPVTSQINFVTFRSGGADSREGTGDDFNAAIFPRIVAEQAAYDSAPLPGPEFAFTGFNGAITGTVTDQGGAIVIGASVKATHLSSRMVYETKTDDKGEFFFGNLPTGTYELLFEANGFKKSIITQVSVFSFDTKVDAVLSPSGVTETVTVTAGREETMTLQKESSQISSTANIVTKSGLSLERVNARAQIATPRLREYFPETLLWQPEIETDREGRAQIKFKLADNITTWKMAVIASTLDGQVATLEQEIRAFQPFFIDHDPPRALTEGDEIALPVVLRNYLDRAQTVETEITPENWFTLLGSAKRRSTVAARDTAREVFEFRAIAPVKEGRQRVTGYGTEMSDAIEKKISVRPDGEEIAQTASKIFNDATAFDLDVPASAIKNSIEGRLRIYPNLLAHLIESIEAIMERPYGCAEQTISSAYPSVLALRYYKQRGEEFPAVARKALRYAQAGYERLLGYQNEDGGFTYWGRDASDVALTSYALQFLEDASEFIQVDEEVVQEARDWLIGQQSDGRWVAQSWDRREDRRLTALVTAYTARALARSRDKMKTAPAIKLALDYLTKSAAEIDEPYLMASLALAAEESGAKEIAAKAREKLRAMARDEDGAAYWSLEANTPFYGWGLAGRIETSALAVQALAADTKSDMASRSLLFLIRNKDRYGVWYSTQATINVLEAMLAMLLKQDARSSASPGQAEVFVNGRRAVSVDLPAGHQLSGPVTVDLSGFLQTGANHIEIKRGAGSMAATAQLVTTHYAPWANTNDTNVRRESSSTLKLKVNFDRTEARAGEEITCRVEAERIGFHGYGMMLAEVGLPPGVDVDRTSLDLAMKQSGWSLSQYDVLPDRVIVYLWPRAGGSKFEFKFKPRYGIRARNTPSMIYDYYNPEAQATVAPVKFVVK